MKEETLEEAVERYAKEEFFSDHEIEIKIGKSGFIKGAKWQQEKMYSEEEVHKIIESYQNIMENNPIHIHYDKWFKQFKKHKGGEQ